MKGKVDNYEKRMYGLVPYNISDIQKSIQFGHSVVEAFNHFEGKNRELLYDWSRNWKTFIILNGGTTNWGTNGYKGSLNQHYETLLANKVNFSYFKEPDLGDQLTAITFIVDERVFNKEKYPDYIEYILPEDMSFENFLINPNPVKRQTYEEWVEKVGGEKNVFLREFLEPFRLA